jgi:branched-chain amino acid transport system ATP-binding protein
MSAAGARSWFGGRSRSDVPVPGLQAASGASAVAIDAGLEVDQLTVRFGGLLALDEVSLSVAPGEVVGLIGPNGAGKTTLFNAISGFVRATRGRIRWRGRPLRNHRAHDLGRLGIARTLQGVGLCHGLTAVENVVCGAQPSLHADLASALGGLWRSSREERRIAGEAASLLAELGVAEWARRYPGSLPYGVQKRVALARALISRPQLLLLDEPASGLAADDIDDLCSQVQGLRDRMSVLLVEHRMDFVMATCDRIVVLNFGEVVASGTPAEIQASPAVTEAYLGDAVTVPGSLPAEGSVDAPG